MLDGEGYTEDLVNHGTQIKCLISRHAKYLMIQLFHSAKTVKKKEDATNYYLLPPTIYIDHP